MFQTAGARIRMEEHSMTEFIIAPNGLNKATAHKMAQDVVNLIVDHFSSMADKPVWTNQRDGLSTRSDAATWAEVMEDFHNVLTHSMQVAHPKFFGHMDSGPLYVSVLADWVTSALNQNLLTWELSPLATVIENEVIAWLCDRCGYSDGEGALVSGGTAANLTALLLALQHVTGGRFRTEGVWALAQRPIIFTSEQAHYSITKSAASTGLGESSVMKVGTDDAFCMEPEKLKIAIVDAKRRHCLPILVVATIGTTSTGSVDPVTELADICEANGIWLHVDAAHGGGALFSSTVQNLLNGIERADSITIDPHKWLMQSKGIGIILTRHKDSLRQMFESAAPYLARTADVQAPPQNRGSLTLQGSRRFDALRLWVTQRYLGDTGISALVEHSLAQVREWTDLLKANPEIELAHEPQLNLLCFRYRSDDVEMGMLDIYNESIQRELMNSGKGFVSLTSLRGHRWLRSVFINPSTTKADMLTVLSSIVESGRRVCRGTRP